MKNKKRILKKKNISMRASIIFLMYLQSVFSCTCETPNFFCYYDVVTAKSIEFYSKQNNFCFNFQTYSYFFHENFSYLTV